MRPPTVPCVFVFAVIAHNKDPSKERISSVLCLGLGTAVGRMPFKRAAIQVHVHLGMFLQLHVCVCGPRAKVTQSPVD